MNAKPRRRQYENRREDGDVSLLPVGWVFNPFPKHMIQAEMSFFLLSLSLSQLDVRRKQNLKGVEGCSSKATEEKSQGDALAVTARRPRISSGEPHAVLREW